MKRTKLAAAMTALDSVEAADADSSRCADLLTSITQLRGWLDATEARITARLIEVHDTAGAAPAADVHTRCGGVSAAEGKRKERRSKRSTTPPHSGARSPMASSEPSTSMRSRTLRPSSTTT